MTNNLLVLLFVAATAVAPSENERIILIKNDLFQISIDSDEIEERFKKVIFDAETGNLQMMTNLQMHSILIYKAEEMIFMLPVMSDKVMIGQSIFDEGGSYKLGFKFKDESQITFADMVMN